MPASVPLTLDDLPRYSPWPSRLLGLTPWRQRAKTPEEVAREYEGDKWGPLLRHLAARGGPVTVDDADDFVLGPTGSWPCWIDGGLELLAARDALARQLDTIAAVLAPHCPAPALVELGAGYGSVLLNLAKRPPFAGMLLVAGEYAPSGVELLRRLAAGQGVPIGAGTCDFHALDLTPLGVPPGAVVFTSFATPCVPCLQPSFVAALCAVRPKVVVHIEPCYEHCDPATLTGLLRQRYIEVNDYNRNLVDLLHAEVARGALTLHEERPAVFGSNPLLAASVLVWSPNA